MKRSGQLVIGLAVTVLALAYTVRNVSWPELRASFATVEAEYLAATTALMILTYAARTFRWHTLVNPIQPVRVLALVSPMMVGFLAGVLPARAGEFVRAYLLGKSQKLSFASAFATIVVERMFDMAALLLMLAWLLVFHAELFDSATAWSGLSVRDLAFNFGIVSLAGVGALGLFIYLLAFRRETALNLVRWMIRPLPERWGYRVIQLVDTFGQGLDVLRRPAALVQISLATGLVWFLIVAAYYPLFFAYHLSNTSVPALVLLTLMICILITVAPTPAFLGSFNVGVLIALHGILKEPEVAAVSFGFVAWGLNFLVVLVGGLYFTLHDHISLKQIAELEKEAEG